MLMRPQQQTLSGPQSDGVAIADIFFDDDTAAIVGAGLQIGLDQISSLIGTWLPGVGPALKFFAGGALTPAKKANSLLTLAAKYSALYLPKGIAEQVIAKIDADSDYWQAAFKDSLVWYTIKPNAVLGLDTALQVFGLNTSARGRFADDVYQLAVAKGAPTWAAAAVAAQVADASAAWDKKYKYIETLTGKTGKPAKGYNSADITKFWDEKVLSLKGQLGTLGGKPAGGGIGLLPIAVGLGALFLITRGQ